MPRNSSSNVIRIEVTLHKEKHADIIQAMQAFDSQAGFLKFAARQYIKEQEKEKEKREAEHRAAFESEKEAAQAASLAEAEPEKEDPILPEPVQPQKRRLPPGMGQSQSRRLED